MQSYDAIVLGAGGVGGAALYHLARRGLRVVGIDRFLPPHNRGSSHGQTRVIRQAYFEHPDYVPLLIESYRLWHELEQESGRQLFTQCGLLEVGPAEGVVVPGVLHAAELHQLEVETLSAREVTHRWPALRVPEGLDAVFEPTAGYLAVEDCVATHLHLASRHGAQLVTDCTISGWQSHRSHIEVATSQGTFATAHLVIAAGAWTRDLLPELGQLLIPLRKALFWFGAQKLPHCRQLPTYLFEWDREVYYGFPSLDGETIKVAQHSGGEALENPLEVSQTIDPAEEMRLAGFLRQCLPDADPRVLDHKTCLYTVTPDLHFVVDRLERDPRVLLAAGLSGHGFKFSPVLGRALADLVTDGNTTLPVDFLSAARFEQ